MADSSHDREIIESFMAVTGASEEVARFHVEASGNTLDVAVAAYYDASNPEDPVDVDNEDGDNNNTNATQSMMRSSAQATAASVPHPAQMTAAAAVPKKKTGASSRRGNNNNSNIRGFGDLRDAGGDDSDDSDDNQPNQYFTGGERSGMRQRMQSAQHAPR